MPHQLPEMRTSFNPMSESSCPYTGDCEWIVCWFSDTKGVTVTQPSNWRQRWQNLREENPISNCELLHLPPDIITNAPPVLYSLRMRYDESDHVVVRGSRAVTDRVGDAFGSVMNQSDMALALAEIKKIDRSFDKEKFIERCRFEIIPTVLEVGVAFGIM